MWGDTHVDFVYFEQFFLFMQLHVRFVWGPETTPSASAGNDRTAIDKCANP